MTAKEYLLQIKEQRNDILNQEEYIQRLRDSLGVAGIRYDKERVQSSPEPDKFAKIFGQIFEEEEMLCIRFHMGAYVTDDLDAFDRAIRKYQSVLFTHTADMYASKVKDV